MKYIYIYIYIYRYIYILNCILLLSVPVLTSTLVPRYKSLCNYNSSSSSDTGSEEEFEGSYERREERKKLDTTFQVLAKLN